MGWLLPIAHSSFISFAVSVDLCPGDKCDWHAKFNRSLALSRPSCASLIFLSPYHGGCVLLKHGQNVTRVFRSDSDGDTGGMHAAPNGMACIVSSWRPGHHGHEPGPPGGDATCHALADIFSTESPKPPP